VPNYTSDKILKSATLLSVTPYTQMIGAVESDKCCNEETQLPIAILFEKRLRTFEH